MRPDELASILTQCALGGECWDMTSYRFLDAMGDVVEEGDFEDHAAALAWATDGDHDEEVQRVEYLDLGPQRDWRWAGPLLD